MDNGLNWPKGLALISRSEVKWNQIYISYKKLTNKTFRVIGFGSRKNIWHEDIKSTWRINKEREIPR